MQLDKNVSRFGTTRRGWLQRSLALSLGATACLSTWAHSGVVRKPTAGAPLRVAFISPGYVGELYWKAGIEGMQQVAQSFGMQFEVLHGLRNQLVTVRQAQLLANRVQSERPDCVLFANELSAGPEILRILNAAGIPALNAYSGFQEDLRTVVGYPREQQKYPLWLGSLGHDATEAGYMTAKALIERAEMMGLHAKDGSLHMLAIQGNRSTKSSVQRNRGMLQAVQESPRVKLQQGVMADWLREKAYEQASILYQRYPEVSLVWAGNDLMAFGAMEAWRQKGGIPGQDALFSGINTSPEALGALKDGSLSALAGGHFMNGAWAMVLLYDYVHGIDFKDEGLEQVHNMFVLFDSPMVMRFEQRFGENAPPLDFSRYSKVKNPDLKRYSFDIRDLLTS